MAIIEVLKQGEVDGSDIKYKKNAAKPKLKSIDNEVSLNSLNQKKKTVFEFTKNENPEMVRGHLKTERGVVGIIFSTMLMFFLLLVGFSGLIFSVFKVYDLKFELFVKKSVYTLKDFNVELLCFLLTLIILLVIISLVLVIFINFSVKVRFRKSYLSKSNVYVYDTFLIVFNIFIFSIVGVVFFYVLDGYYVEFKNWINEGLINSEVNLWLVNLFKYIIVIISAIFISLNSFKGISITHKANEFIFKNHL